MVRPALPRAFFKGLPEQVNEVWGVTVVLPNVSGAQTAAAGWLARVSLQNRVDGRCAKDTTVAG